MSRTKCLEYLATPTIKELKQRTLELDRESRYQKKIEFLPYIRERDVHGNLITSNTTNQRKKKKFINLKRGYAPSSLTNYLFCLESVTDTQRPQKSEVSTKLKTDTSVNPISQRTEKNNELINSHFQLQMDGMYMNEHQQKKKVPYRRLENLLSYRSIQRQSQVPSFCNYEPNYQLQQKKSYNAFISKTKIPTDKLKIIESSSQPYIKNSNSTDRYQVRKAPNPISQAFTKLMKEIAKEVDHDENNRYKSPLDNLIVDISQFNNKVNKTIEKAHLSKQKLLLMNNKKDD